MFETSRQDNRLYAIQALRGFAASAVVIYHAVEATLRNTIPEGGGGS